MRYSRFLMIICFCFSFNNSPAQQSKIDSLLQVLEHSAEDTNKALTINKLARELALAGNFEESRKYCNDARALSEKLHFIPGLASSYLNNGITYFYEGNYETALENYNSAFTISEKNNFLKGIAHSLNNMGLVYTYQQKYSEAFKYYKDAFKIYEKIKDTTGLSNASNNIGIIFEEQGNYPEAIKYYYTALELFLKKGEKKGIADAYLNLANVYGLRSYHSEALKNYYLAEKYYGEIDYKPGLTTCYVALGLNYQEVDSLEKAMYYSQKANELSRELGNTHTAVSTKNSMGAIYLAQKKYQKAKECFTETMKIFSEMGDTVNLIACYNGLGQVSFYNNKPDESLNLIMTGLELSKKIGSKSNISWSYKWISMIYEKRRDYKNAFDNYVLATSYNDSLLNETKSKQIVEMQTRFESAQKDNEITLLNKNKEIDTIEIKKQKQLKFSFIGGMGLVIVLLLFGYHNYRTRQTLRLQAIRNKIAGDLHDDIGSTLNSISIYSEVARKKDDQQDEALEMIGDASRKIIDAMSDIVWTVNPDNDNFDKIIFRMKSLAYNLFRAKKIEFTFHSDETLTGKKLPLEVRRNFYLVFKEAVNNLVKYSAASRAAITLTNEKDFIRLSIKDDGAGFDMAQETQGNGLKNMKRRADEIKAKFKIESSKGNGTHLELILKA